MHHCFNRRDFLAVSAAAGVGLWASTRLEAAPWKTKLHKSLIGAPNEATLTSWKAAGFEGIESGQRHAPLDEAKEARKLAEKLGMRVHSVLYGWANFNTDSVASDVESVARSLETAGAYGSDALLLVPCRTGGMPMPEAWEFDIEFDEKTGHLTRVVAGDNERFKPYMAAHDRSLDSAREGIKRMIPIAEETKVVIALENVWNNWCVRPELYRWLVASFQSPWVKAYFDIGNHVKYAAAMRDGRLQIVYPPEVWIRAFGPLLAKIHVKDYKLNADLRGGNWAGIGQGTVDWPAVRKAFEDIGYNGWLTDETGLAWPELNRRLDRIIAGQPPVVPGGK